MKALRGWIIAIVILGAAIAAIPLLTRPKPVEVRVATIAAGLVEETVTSTKAGSVRSRRIADLSVEVAGTIVAIHAREGARVKQGTPLVSIDRRDADAALAAAQRELAVLESLVEEAKARHKDAIRERDLAKQGLADGTGTPQQLDAAETQVAVMAAAVAAAEARVESQKTVVQRARLGVDKCELTAPFDGVVAERLVEVGEWAVPGKVAVRVLDPDRLYVRAEFDEVDLGPLKTGLPARVTLDPWKDRRITGRVVRVAPIVNELKEQNRTVEVEVEIERGAEGLTLTHGTSADVEIILDEKPGVLRVPTLALLQGGQVLVAGADGVAHAVTVKTGMRNWEFAEIVEGLRAGDRVIVSLESERVKDGAAIVVKSEAER